MQRPRAAAAGCARAPTALRRHLVARRRARPGGAPPRAPTPADRASSRAPWPSRPVRCPAPDTATCHQDKLVLVSLSSEERRRYSRHLLLPEIGEAGQARLKAARVLLVGAGGLGSPAALYLAAAGVGTIGLVEFDRVDETNLQRQILYGTSDVGLPKIDVAAKRIRAI